jgi:hypothetical protein
MALDYTKLVQKLTPPRDGEDTLRLRVGTVTTVNANGTLDITMSSGILVPGVPKLATAYAPAGAVVQMISFRGSLMVIGATGSGGAHGGMTKTGSTTTGPSAATSFSTVVAFGVTFPAMPNVHLNLRLAPGSTSGWNFRAINISTTGFTIFGFGASSTFSEPIQWTAIYAP